MKLIDGDELLKNLPLHPDGGMRSIKGESLMIRVRQTVMEAPNAIGNCESCTKWDHRDGVGVSARKCEEWQKITSRREFCSRWRQYVG